MSQEDSRKRRKRKRSSASAPRTIKKARRGGPGTGHSRPSSSTERDDNPGPSTSGSTPAPQQPAESRSPGPSSAAPLEDPVGQGRSGGAHWLSRSRSPRRTSSGPRVFEEFWDIEDHPLVPADWRLSLMSPVWPHMGGPPEYLQLVLPTVPCPQEVGLFISAGHFMLVTPPSVPASSIPVLQDTMRDSFSHSAYSSELVPDLSTPAQQCTCHHRESTE